MPTNLYDKAQFGEVLTSIGTAINDRFGSAVAFNGDGSVMVVGAQGRISAKGIVYTYDWSGNRYVPRGSGLTAADGTSIDFFGGAVALSDDGLIMAVGAYGWEGAVSNQGCVYIYDWSGGAWVQRGSVLIASDAVASDGFGYSVTMSADGSVLVVGAWQRSSLFGGVYIYDWTGGAWVQRGSVLTAADAAADNYGWSVALSGDASILAVGAALWEGANANQGGVYIYDWTGGAWVQRGSVLTAGDAASNANFGSAVALSDDGNTLAVGAQGKLDTLTSQGGVYILQWNSGAWVQRGSVLIAADPDFSDLFGSALAIDNNVTVLTVGARDWDNALTNSGAVYRYDLYFHKLSNAAGDPVADDAGAAAVRTIHANEHATGRAVGNGVSDGSGLFEFGVCTADECYVVAFDDVAGLPYNALVLDQVTPL